MCVNCDVCTPRSKRLVYSLGYDDVKRFYDLPLDQQENNSCSISKGNSKRNGPASASSADPLRKKRCVAARKQSKQSSSLKVGGDAEDGDVTSGSNDEKESQQGGRGEYDGEEDGAEEDLLGAVQKLQGVNSNRCNIRDDHPDDPCYEDMTREDLVRQVKGYKKLSRRKDKELAKALNEVKEMEV